MSSIPSNTDVIRTQITNYIEEDGTVLYADGSKPAHLINITNASYHSTENVQPEASSCEEEPKTVGDVLTRCQVIRDSIQTLEKKFSDIDGKVSKIQRLQMKSVWQTPRPFGSSCRTFGYRLSQRIKNHRPKDCARVSDPKSDNPTSLSMLQNAEGDSEAPTMEVSLPAQEPVQKKQASPLPEQGPLQQKQASPLPEQGALAEGQASSLQPQIPPHPQDPRMSVPYAAQSYPTYCIFKNITWGPSSKSSFLSPESSGSLGASVCDSAAVAGNGQQRQAQHTELKARRTSLENKKNPSQSKVSTLSTATTGENSAVEPNKGVLKQSFSDPSAWSVDEVILFLKQSDSKSFGPLADIFREQGIDGNALLLLTKDAMIQYMDIKVGIALKVYDQIEKLKRK